MASSTQDLDGLERRRIDLEQNVNKLQASLRYWRTWEAEYEALKEEIQQLRKNANAAQIQAVADGFGGNTLTPKECKEILKTSSGTPRDCAQILNILARRIDYVEENTKTAQKQLAKAKSELETLDESHDAPGDEPGFLLQEITEILDENDNVVSSSVTDAKAAAPEILEVLRKSGIQGIPETQAATPAIESEPAEALREDDKQDEDGPVSTEAATLESTMSMSQNPSLTATRSEPDHEYMDHDMKALPPPKDGTSAPASVPKTVHGDVLENLKEDFPRDAPVPEGETPEEAALRREMLQYNIDQVGAVVATIDLDNANINDSGDDNNPDSYDEDDDEDEPEDEYGRTTVRVIGDDYRKQMLELEARLNVKALTNVGPTAPKHSDIVESEPTAAPARSAIQPQKKQKTSKGEKKAVRFAEALDVNEALTQSAPDSSSLPSTESAEQPVSDTVIERAAPAAPDLQSPSKPKRVSKFSAMRAGAPKDTVGKRSSASSTSIQSGPLAGKQGSLLSAVAPKKAASSEPGGMAGSEDGADARTHSDRVVERPMSEASKEVTEPDEFDPRIMHQQVAVEYHRMRNRLIQRKGGFVDRDYDDEEGEEEEYDEEGQSGKKISRFKAAQLSKIVR